MLHRITTQIGQTATDHGQICKQVREYLAAVSIDAPDGACPEWDGALLAWCAIKDGIVPPLSAANPMAWIVWGTPLDTPTAGAVAVLTSGSGRARMTCGMIARTNGLKVYVIGAFDGVVQMKVVPLEQVIAVRRPPGASLPAEAPATASHEIVIRTETAPLQIAPPAPAMPSSQIIANSLPIMANSPPPPASETIGIEALQALLDHVKAEFESVHSRIDQVATHAVAAVQIEHQQD